MTRTTTDPAIAVVRPGSLRAVSYWVGVLAVAGVISLAMAPAVWADDWAEPNDAFGEEERIGDGATLQHPDLFNTGALEWVVEDLELEPGDDAVDWFGFTAFAGSPIAIRVHPVATDADHPNDARNLGLRLYRRVSATTGELGLLAQIDFNQTGEDEYHPPIIYTLAGYMLVEIYSDYNVNNAQPYRLTVSNATIEEEEDEPPDNDNGGFNGACAPGPAVAVSITAVGLFLMRRQRTW